MRERNVDPDTATIVIYTSPFLRCVETTTAIARGMSSCRPMIRVEIGLAEWMSEHFFDQVCPASEMVGRRHEALAREQATAFSQKSKTPYTVDYAYRSLKPDFEFPERYADMLKRFQQVGSSCVQGNNQTVVIMVTHAIGVHALLDGFRHRLTRPIESKFCSISCVMRANSGRSLTSLPSPPSEDDHHGDQWIVDLEAFDAHLAWPLIPHTHT